MVTWSLLKALIRAGGKRTWLARAGQAWLLFPELPP